MIQMMIRMSLRFHIVSITVFVCGGEGGEGEPEATWRFEKCVGTGDGGVVVEDFIAHEGRRFPESNFLNWPWGKSLYQLNLFTM